MPKRIAPKSLRKIMSLPDGVHAVGHVPGLCLQRAGESRSWLLRYSRGGLVREMGLGSLREVTLDEACDAARTARKLLREGIDPIEERNNRRAALLAGDLKTVTFATAVRQYLAAHSAAWKNHKHRQQWANTLATYAEPTIGELPVDRVQTPHVIALLEPIWRTKTETASRVRQRVESVLDFAIARGFRTDRENPARWKGHLENLLPAPTKVSKVEHFAALPWRDLPDFMVRLRTAEGMGARALEFAILTAARSGEVRGATWDEIDLGRALWSIPGERMKVEQPHVVPLSPPALALLRALPRLKGCSLLFPSPKSTPLSDMTLTAVLRRMTLDATTHGFRSGFRDWCAEATNAPREVAEKCLAHTIGNAVEAAYRRGDLMQKRTALMRQWAVYLGTPKKKVSLVALGSRKAKR